MVLAVDFGIDNPKRTYCEEEYCNRNGAIALKEKIEAYWAARGYSVEVELRNAGFHPAMRTARYTARYDVRSNLKDGLPPKKPLDALANQRTYNVT